jgi:Holliday junction DNA helicase RuvA
VISGLRGRLERRGADWAVVSVGGISFRVAAPISTTQQLGDVGAEVALHTHLHVREEVLALFGFATLEELELFQRLISVSGVGPALAINILSALPPDRLRSAIVAGNEALLASVPRVGKKTAARIVIDLRGKLGPATVGAAGPALAAGGDEVAEALATFGYGPAQIARALRELPDDPDLSTEDRIVLALRLLAPK